MIDDDKTKFKDTENVKNRLCSLSNSIDESTYKDDIPSSESTFSFIITPTTINETNCGLKNTNENSSTLCFKSNIIDPNKLHPQIFKMHNSEHHTPSSTNTSNIRRQRHSISGQMSYFNKVFGFGSFKKMATSTNSLFSTAVISGSSSAPNLRDMIPSTASPSGKFMKKGLAIIILISMVLEGFGGVPPIRPLETLHNALSLKQLDIFLEKVTTTTFKTPACSPKNPSDQNIEFTCK